MALRFLLVDDSAAVRHALRGGLNRAGITPDDVLEAASAGEALRIFRRMHPEIVFMDISLAPRVVVETDGSTGPIEDPSEWAPAEEGDQLGRRMLQEDPSIKLVVCTGNARDDPRVREMVKQGAFYVLEKPVKFDHISQILHRLAEEGVMLSSTGPLRRTGGFVLER